MLAYHMMWYQVLRKTLYKSTVIKFTQSTKADRLQNNYNLKNYKQRLTSDQLR